jgi:hypothetical protein
MKDEHILVLTLADLQRLAQDEEAHGPIEMSLLELLAGIKSRKNARPVFVRIDFPPEGGLHLRCRQGWWVRALYSLRDCVRIWKT